MVIVVNTDLPDIHPNEITLSNKNSHLHIYTTYKMQNKQITTSLLIAGLMAIGTQVATATTTTTTGNTWTLSCGSSCDDLTSVVATGDYSSAQECIPFPATYDYCYLDKADTVAYGVLYTIPYIADDCVATAGSDDGVSYTDSGICWSAAGYSSAWLTLNV